MANLMNSSLLPKDTYFLTPAYFSASGKVAFYKDAIGRYTRLHDAAYVDGWFDGKFASEMVEVVTRQEALDNVRAYRELMKG